MKLRIPNRFGGWGFLSFVAHLSVNPFGDTMWADKTERGKRKKKIGGTYKQVGDYSLPDVGVPESPALGIW